MLDYMESEMVTAPPPPRVANEDDLDDEPQQLHTLSPPQLENGADGELEPALERAVARDKLAVSPAVKMMQSLAQELQIENVPIKQLQSPNQSFHYSKQHTGLKNLSFNVGAAVMPSGKMQFDQEKPESFGVVKIPRPLKNLFAPPEPHPIIGRKKTLRLDIPNPNRLSSNYSTNNLTDQGYLDLKFYHNKLW